MAAWRGYRSPLDPVPPFNLFDYRLAAAATASAVEATVRAVAEIARLRTEQNRHLADPGVGWWGCGCLGLAELVGCCLACRLGTGGLLLCGGACWW